MSELAMLESLEARTHLLARAAGPPPSLELCGEFTRRAAWELRERGWRLIRKTAGQNVRGLDSDKIIHADTLEIVDIIVGAGGPSPRPAWQGGHSGVPSMIVMPVDEWSGNGGGPPALRGVEELLAELVTVLGEVRGVLAEMQQEQAAIRDVLTRAATRFGI